MVDIAVDVAVVHHGTGVGVGVVVVVGHIAVVAAGGGVRCF